MSTVTLEFKWRIGGTLTAATSVLLSDSTGTYGVKRMDTDAVVVADGTAMTAASTGVYRYTFAAPAAALEYSWVAEVLYGGVTYRFEREFNDAVGAASWHYADYDDVKAVLGLSDLAVIDDPDNDGSENLGLVQTAGDWADAFMDARFAAFGYTTPLADTDPNADLLLQDISAKLVICQLNQSRALIIASRSGVNQQGVDRVMTGWWKEANSMLVSLSTGILRMSATKANVGPSAAVAAFGTPFTVPVSWWPSGGRCECHWQG